MDTSQCAIGSTLRGEKPYFLSNHSIIHYLPSFQWQIGLLACPSSEKRTDETDLFFILYFMLFWGSVWLKLRKKKGLAGCLASPFRVIFCWGKFMFCSRSYSFQPTEQEGASLMKKRNCSNLLFSSGKLMEWQLSFCHVIMSRHYDMSK